MSSINVASIPWPGHWEFFSMNQPSLIKGWVRGAAIFCLVKREERREKILYGPQKRQQGFCLWLVSRRSHHNRAVDKQDQHHIKASLFQWILWIHSFIDSVSLRYIILSLFTRKFNLIINVDSIKSNQELYKDMSKNLMFPFRQICNNSRHTSNQWLIANGSVFVVKKLCAIPGKCTSI